MQKLLTLIITAAILYILFQQGVNTITVPEHLRKENFKAAEEKTPEFNGNFIEKTISSVLMNVLKTEEGRMFLESMLQPHNKAMAGSGAAFEMNSDHFINSLFKISTFGEGSEGPASCGHIVTVNYKVLTNSNRLIEEKTTTFPLGSGKASPGLDAVVAGMKTGQIRHATISSKYVAATTDPNADRDAGTGSYKVQVLLKEIIPHNFVDDTTKIFDDQLAYKIPMLCAGRAVYDARIIKISDGSVIFDSTKKGSKIDMQIGNLSYPIIFSHSLHNKIPVGKRTVIAKGKLFKSYASEYSTIFPDKVLPENEYYMVEFFNFDNLVATPTTTYEHIKAGYNQQ